MIIPAVILLITCAALFLQDARALYRRRPARIPPSSSSVHAEAERVYVAFYQGRAGHRALMEAEQMLALAGGA